MCEQRRDRITNKRSLFIRHTKQRFRTKHRVTLNTYDLRPLPYCPIILESTLRLTDRPNWTTFPTSAAKWRKTPRLQNFKSVKVKTLTRNPPQRHHPFNVLEDAKKSTSKSRTLGFSSLPIIRTTSSPWHTLSSSPSFLEQLSFSAGGSRLLQFIYPQHTSFATYHVSILTSGNVK